MKCFFATLSTLLGLAGPLCGQVQLNSVTSTWMPIVYPGVTSDFFADEQATSTESDLVGNPTYAAVYTKYYDGGTDRSVDNTDGQLAFRVRMGGEKNPVGYSSVLWFGLAIEGIGDSGGVTDLDVFLGYDSGTDTIGVHGAGGQANTSPNTTSIVFNATASGFTIAADPTNYLWAPVSAIDAGLSAADYNLDGSTKGGQNNEDHFLTVIFPINLIATAVSSLAGGAFTDETAFGVVAATATQTNSLNQDLNGVDGGTNSAISWDNLNAISPLMDSTGSPVPEPAHVAALLGLVVLGWSVCRRRR